MEQFRQRIIAALHLKAMDSEETRNYIEFRLGLVDWKDDPQITAGAFEQIFDFTKGVPRRINNLCDRLFLFGCLEERHLLDEGAVRSVISEIEEEGLGNAAVPEPKLPARKLPQTSTVTPDFDVDYSASDTMPPGDQLMQRLSILEREIQQLKKNQQHEKKLLRKAILIQMDMDVEDAID